MIQVTLPKLGESITTATIVQWFKKTGEQVALDEPLLAVSTDKVNSEIPSPISGIIHEIVAKVDQEVEVGALLAWITPSEQLAAPSLPESNVPAASVGSDAKVQDLLSPAVLRLAQAEGVDIASLNKIEGTGEGGRITKKDLELFIKNSKSILKNDLSKPCCAHNTKEERVKLSGMRKAIAENMTKSFYEAPHASLVSEIDVTEIMNFIAKEKEQFFKIHGVKLSITSFIIHALAKVVQDYPFLNASLEEDMIVCKRYVNIGIAVNIDHGLVVPVIRNCQERNLISIAKELSELANKARTNRLHPDDVKESTLTVTNFGMTGALIGTPIIHYPEVAILGIGAVQKRVVVKEDDSIAIRKMVYLSMTFDHRVVDGVYVCEFLASLKKMLEQIPESISH